MVRKSCRNFGIVIHDEGPLVKDHQSNGAAEVTVQVLRSKAGLLIQQIEDKVAGGRLIFGCNHPLYLVHVGFDSCCWMVAQQVCCQCWSNSI